MADCPICCDSFTDIIRKPINCSICNYAVCTRCIKTYLLGSFKDPHCMKCNVAWNREFIDTVLSKAFRTKDLKTHRENILVDREKSMLPATIPLVEEELRKRKILKEISAIQIEKQKLLAELRELDMQIIEKTRSYHGGNKDKKTNTVYQKPCPSNDCRGFLSDCKCSLCEVKVCSKCHVIIRTKDEPEEVELLHECKPDDLATSQLLEKDTRFCPNEACRAPIFKISGCAQMFCTKCHTAFDWETGTIVNNNATIHNPHYYEYLRQQNNGQIPRNIGDVPCGGMPQIYQIMNVMKAKKISNPIQYKVTTCHRGLQHIIHYEIHRHPINLVGGDAYTQLRVRYLLKEISEDDWKKELQRIEKKNEKNIAFRHVFDMIIAISIDMFNKILICENDKEVNEIMTEMETLKTYFNETIEKITYRFSTTKNYNCLDEDWLYSLKKPEVTLNQPQTQSNNED